MGPSWWQILIVLVLFVLLFGRGKISDLMGDVAKGIKSFKTGLADDGEEKAEAGAPAAKTSDPKVIEHETPAPKPRAKPRARVPRKQKTS
jgi:sec-independent protein translocase protein TatA